MPEQRIVACGGALGAPEAAALRDYIFALARRQRPRVCFLPTPSADHPETIAHFYRVAAAHECRPSDLPLFKREVEGLRAFLMEQDVIWVAGGNTANALAFWRVHGVDTILREAWEAGCVMTGASAGMNCWFEASVTDSFSLKKLEGLRDWARLAGGLGLSALGRRGDAPTGVSRPGRRRVPGRRGGGGW